MNIRTATDDGISINITPAHDRGETTGPAHPFSKTNVGEDSGSVDSKFPCQYLAKASGTSASKS